VTTKEWVQIIGSLSGFVLAAASLVTALKGRETARAGYEEHTRAIMAAQRAVVENHEAIAEVAQAQAVAVPVDAGTFPLEIVASSSAPVVTNPKTWPSPPPAPRYQASAGKPAAPPRPLPIQPVPRAYDSL
jgi:hypothetical protein